MRFYGWRLADGTPVAHVAITHSVTPDRAARLLIKHLQPDADTAPELSRAAVVRAIRAQLAANPDGADWWQDDYPDAEDGLDDVWAWAVAQVAKLAG